MESEEMEMFWFFHFQFHQAYDSAYNSDFRFLLVISSLMTPTQSLVKTSLQRGMQKISLNQTMLNEKTVAQYVYKLVWRPRGE